MKKFIFSAVAMMAFSVSSMANTIAIEESLTVVDCHQVSEDFAATIVSVNSGDLPNCDAEKFKAYVAARSAGFDHQTASWMSNSIYFTCMQLRADHIF